MAKIVLWCCRWWRCPVGLLLAVAGLVALEPDDPAGPDVVEQAVVVAGLGFVLPGTWQADESPAGGCLAVWRDQSSDLVLAVARAPRLTMSEGFAAWVDGERRALTELGEHGVEIVEDQSWQSRPGSGWLIAYRFSFIGHHWYQRAHLMQVDGLGLIVTLACPADQQAESHDQMAAIVSSFSPVVVPDTQGSTP